MNKRVVIRAIVLLGLAIVVGMLVFTKISASSESDPAAGAAQEEGEKATRVTTYEVEPTTLYDTLSVVGTLEASEVVAVRNETSGKVVRLGFEEGQAVSSGELLVQMRDDALRAERRVQSRRRDLLALEVERLGRALENNAISQHEYDVARAEEEIAAAELERIDATLDQTAVYAPFDGVVGLREVSQGAIVTAGTDIAWLRRVDPLELQFSVPERFAADVEVGQPLRFEVFGVDGARSAEITAVESGLDATSRTLRVQAEVENGDGAIRAGALANVQLILEERPDVLTIPAAAIIESSEGSTVWVNRDGRAEEQAIEKGNRGDRQVEIIDGLEVGDAVVVTGRHALDEGQKLEVDDSEDAVDIDTIAPDGTTSGMRNQWFSEEELEESLRRDLPAESGEAEEAQ